MVYETSLGTPDDEALQDAMLQRAAEKEPDYFGAQLSQVPAADYYHVEVLAAYYRSRSASSYSIVCYSIAATLH